jgi:hypothetical protein
MIQRSAGVDGPSLPGLDAARDRHGDQFMLFTLVTLAVTYA